MYFSMTPVGIYFIMDIRYGLSEIHNLDKDICAFKLDFTNSSVLPTGYNLISEAIFIRLHQNGSALESGKMKAS